jgi:hypothetical protein
VSNLDTVFHIRDHLKDLYHDNILTRLNRIKNLNYGESSHAKFGWKMPEGLKTYLEYYATTQYKDTPTDAIKELIDWEVYLSTASCALSVGASMVLYSYKKEIYIQFFGVDDQWPEAEKYIETLEKKGTLQEFYYQNQTDDRFDDKEYMKRGKIWDKIFSKSSMPCLAGFVYDFWAEGNHILWHWRDSLE